MVLFTCHLIYWLWSHATCRFIPLEERSRAVSFVFSGLSVGSVTGYVMFKSCVGLIQDLLHLGQVPDSNLAFRIHKRQTSDCQN